ncbi:hypothetical protein LX36DRAFT_320476 [Colletotrichum falcatum]|nr:hypothetical protein LX36DRAFT_320476 [Colletotrichum falcatum]
MSQRNTACQNPPGAQGGLSGQADKDVVYVRPWPGVSPSRIAKPTLTTPIAQSGDAPACVHADRNVRIREKKKAHPPKRRVSRGMSASMTNFRVEVGSCLDSKQREYVVYGFFDLKGHFQYQLESRSDQGVTQGGAGSARVVAEHKHITYLDRFQGRGRGGVRRKVLEILQQRRTRQLQSGEI